MTDAAARTCVELPSWLGDAVIATGALLTLDRAGVGPVEVLGTPAALAVCAGLPGVAKRFERPPSWPARWRQLRQLSRRRYAYSISLRSSPGALLGARLIGADQRLGFAGGGGRWAWTATCRRPPRGVLHLAEEYQSLVRLLAPGVPPLAPWVRVTPTERDAARQRLGAEPIVVLAPGALYGPTKRWPAERFVEVGQALGRRGFKSVVVASPGERREAAALMEGLGSSAVDLSGRTTIRELAAVLAQAAGCVANDSGAMHLAAAVATPVVGVFGSTEPRWTGPIGGRAVVTDPRLACAPCYARRCPIGCKCLSEVTTAAVLEALAGEMARPALAPGPWPLRPACFLDRDGTLIEDAHYLKDPAAMVLCPGAASGIRRLNEAGVAAVVITNQSGIARGYLTPGDLEAQHQRLRQLLAAAGAQLDAIYACPHHPDDGCACRKPATGLITQAARELRLDRRRSVVIGDKPSDRETGREGAGAGICLNDCQPPTVDAAVENWLTGLRL